MTVVQTGPACHVLLGRKAGVIVFLALAAAYFCSALVRAITATLSLVLTQEFSLQARDLGLLAGGGYFLGFAAIQLPLGKWLDRHGPKRVIQCFLSVAVLGCLAFSVASNFARLLAARVLVSMGVGACLMAPLTGYQRWFDAVTQLRANSWMLMTGSLGMLPSTCRCSGCCLCWDGARCSGSWLRSSFCRWRPSLGSHPHGRFMWPPRLSLRVLLCPLRGLSLLGAARRCVRSCPLQPIRQTDRIPTALQKSGKAAISAKCCRWPFLITAAWWPCKPCEQRRG